MLLLFLLWQHTSLGYLFRWTWSGYSWCDSAQRTGVKLLAQLKRKDGLMKTLLLEINKVFRAHSHRHTWIWKLLAASISLMICKGIINLILYCTAASTYKSEAWTPSTTGQEPGTAMTSGVPTKSCPPHALSLRKYGAEIMTNEEVGERAFTISSCSPSNPFSIILSIFFFTSTSNPSAFQLHFLYVQLYPEPVSPQAPRRERQA